METRSRKSNSEQNSKISEASEQEVRSRSSDSEQRMSNSRSSQRYLKKPSELKRDQHQKLDSKIPRSPETRRL